MHDWFRMRIQPMMLFTVTNTVWILSFVHLFIFIPNTISSGQMSLEAITSLLFLDLLSFFFCFYSALIFFQFYFTSHCSSFLSKSLLYILFICFASLAFPPSPSTPRLSCSLSWYRFSSPRVPQLISKLDALFSFRRWASPPWHPFGGCYGNLLSQVIYSGRSARVLSETGYVWTHLLFLFVIY